MTGIYMRLVLKAGRLGRRVPSSLPLARHLRRGFTIEEFKIETEEQKPVVETYKPNFRLEFDEKGRLLLYKTMNYIPVIVNALVYLAFFYTVYQVLFKWNKNKKWKNISCILVILATGFSIIYTFQFSRKFCFRLYLKNTGQHVQFRTILWPFIQEAPISDIRPSKGAMKELSAIGHHDLLTLPPNIYFLPWQDENNPVYYFDKNLLEAVLDGKEIELGKLSKSETVDI